MVSGSKRDELFNDLATVGKALANPNRLKIIDLLSQAEYSVDAIATELRTGVTTISAHLQVLKAASVVATRSEGTKVIYRLAGDDVAHLYAALGAVARSHSAQVARSLEDYLAGELPETSEAGPAGVDEHSGGEAEVKQVTKAELERRLNEGNITLIDVRSPIEYAAGHIGGAVSIPYNELVERLEEISALTSLGFEADGQPRSEHQIVAYCRGAHCVLAHEAVRILNAHGYHAVRLEEGFLEWRIAGKAVEV